jgi:hypothetical protein
VVGVRSSSAVGHQSKKRARYHLYHIKRNDDEPDNSRFHIRMAVRAYDATARRFVNKKELMLHADGSFR